MLDYSFIIYHSKCRMNHFYAAAEIALIQRVHILNSGNAPLGFLMRKVVVGPDTGNVGPLLKELDNPTFDTKDLSTIKTAILKALKMSVQGVGYKNYNYAMSHFSTEIIASKLYNYYKSLL